MKQSLFLVFIATFLFFPFQTVLAEIKPLFDSGTESIVDYEKYGEFKGLGTENYKYEIKDRAGLGKAVGEGIYPGDGVYKDPVFIEAQKSGKLKGNHWDFVNIDDQMAAFYKWATTNEDAGVKQFYAAGALARAGHISHAIKAYYAILVHFPKTIGWTYWHTPYYIGKTVLNEIEYLTRTHPELGIKLVGAKITIQGSFDDDRSNDKFVINPGKLVEVKPKDVAEKKVNLSKLKVIKTIGGEHVKLVKYENGYWQLQVDGKPYIIKGMAYSPNKVGLTPDDGSLNVQTDWMVADFNNNGKIDGPYDAFVDKNKNNKQDKDEPYILMWILGNENNYGFPGTPGEFPGMGCKAKLQPEAYYSFINEVAKMIKSIDPHHPVAICNGEVNYLEHFAKYAPDVDVFGANVYRGPHGFGRSLWEDVRDITDKPILITEYGCPSYIAGEEEKAEAEQAEYHKGNWQDIEYNVAGSGFGNALGGVCFEWVDEWWKRNSPNPAGWWVQDEEAGWSNGAYYFDIEVEGHMNMNEEWYGIVGLSTEKENGIDKRVPKKAYYVLKKLWQKNSEGGKGKK